MLTSKQNARIAHAINSVETQQAYGQHRRYMARIAHAINSVETHRVRYTDMIKRVLRMLLIALKRCGSIGIRSVQARIAHAINSVETNGETGVVF